MSVIHLYKVVLGEVQWFQCNKIYHESQMSEMSQIDKMQ